MTLPLSKEEVIDFIYQFQSFSKFFNDEEAVSKVQMKPIREDKPIEDCWDKAAKKVIRELWKHKEAWIFYEPVNPEKLNIPDYFKHIPRPMDLGTVKSNLHGGKFASCEDFIGDVRLIFDNCIQYNGESAPVSVMCQNVRREFERLNEEYYLDFYCREK